MKKLFLILIVSLISFFLLQSCAKVDSIFGPYTLRNLDNVIEDIKDKEVDSIVVKFKHVKNKKIILDTIIIKENNDSINRLIEKKFRLIINKNSSVNRTFKDSLFFVKSNNKFINDSLIISLEIIFKNTVFIKLSVANFYKAGLDIYSDKYSPNAYEFFVFPFMGKGFIRYTNNYKDNPSFVMEDIINLSNDLINYYNFTITNKELKKANIEK